MEQKSSIKLSIVDVPLRKIITKINSALKIIEIRDIIGSQLFLNVVKGFYH